MAISSNTGVWRPGTKLRPAKPKGRGRPTTRLHDAKGKEPVTVDKLATRYEEEGKFRKVTWRQGSKGPLQSKFYAVRVRSAEGYAHGKPPSDEQWLVFEKDPSQQTGFKYYFSSLPKKTTLRTLVRLVKQRWRIERDYQDMKQHLGLDAYEGRSWGGLHRHLCLVALIHAFIALNRNAFCPYGPTSDQKKTPPAFRQTHPSGPGRICTGL